MGPKQINDFTMLGTMVPAAEAKRLGMVNRVVPREKLDKSAMLMAQQLLNKNPWALARIKWLNYRQPNMSINDAVDMSQEVITVWMQLPDAIEGLTAFFEKRKANYEQFKGKTKFV